MERTINDIVKEQAEQGQASQWIPEEDESTHIFGDGEFDYDPDDPAEGYQPNWTE